MLAQDFLDLLEKGRHDFTLAFRRLADLANRDASGDTQDIGELFEFTPAFDDWFQRWHERCSVDTLSPAERQQAMRAVNPAFIPRNHRIEQAIEQAYAGDLTLFSRLLERWQKPFEFDASDGDLAQPPKSHEIVRHTFCGT